MLHGRLSRWSTKTRVTWSVFAERRRRKRSGGVLRAVYGVLCAEAAKVSEAEQRFRAHDDGEVQFNWVSTSGLDDSRALKKGARAHSISPKRIPGRALPGRSG